jgi:DNA-binding NtrC family response regulator
MVSREGQFAQQRPPGFEGGGRPYEGIVRMTARKIPEFRVLIVDDEPLIRWSLAEGLGREGYVVLEAGDRQSALAHFTGGKAAIDLVLLDLRLPDSTDLGLLARIKELAPACEVILITAHGSPDLTQAAREKGAFRVLGKPFDIEEIVGLVGQALAVRPS